MHAAPRVDEEDPPPAVGPQSPEPPRPAPAPARNRLPLVLALAVVAACGAIAFVGLRHHADDAAERRYLASALDEGRDAGAALRGAETLSERVRSRPAVQGAIATLRSEVRAAEARAGALAALARLVDATPARARLDAAERALAADPRCARALVERAR